MERPGWMDWDARRWTNAEVKNRSSGVGRRSSGVGRRASVVGRRASGVGRRSSVVGRRAPGVHPPGHCRCVHSPALLACVYTLPVRRVQRTTPSGLSPFGRIMA